MIPTIFCALWCSVFALLGLLIGIAISAFHNAPCECGILTDSIGLLDEAWNIISNVRRGDWEKEVPAWKHAAERWRSDYFEFLIELNRR